MKKMKKLLSFGLAMMLALSMTTTAFAADTVPTVNIEINDTDRITEAKYAAYRLLDATSLGTPAGGEEQFSYSINEIYRNILKEVTEKETDEDIIKYIDDLSAEGIRKFADDVYQAIKTAKLTADETTEDNTFDAVAQGYYLIAETDLGKVDGKNEPTDSFSLVMLDTVASNVGGTVTIETKEDIPTVDKKVKEVNDSTGATSWGESADHDVNDVIEYQIRGTVSSKYDEYIIYNYQFVDTMDKSLTLEHKSKEDTSIIIYVGGNEDENGIYQSGGIDVTEHFDIKVETLADEAGTRFTASADLKELDKVEGVTITGDTIIYVLYKATLNEHAVHGTSGNKNDVYLNYSNNPYVDSEGEPRGKTPVDTNIVFTFNTLVNKVDEKGNELTGAGFTLYKWNESAEGEGVWKEIKVIETESGSVFDFKGLDCGKYKLEETKVPAGYNKAADIIFEVVATYDKTKDPAELTGLEVVDEDGEPISSDTDTEEAIFIVSLREGKVTTAVKNLPGVVLPSTGGMGTTLFYVLGAVLVLGSVILIVTKKRMGE